MGLNSPGKRYCSTFCLGSAKASERSTRINHKSKLHTLPTKSILCSKLTGHVYLGWVSLPCCHSLIGRRRVEGTENLHTFNPRPVYVRQRDHTVTKHPEGTDRMGFLKTSGSSCRKQFLVFIARFNICLVKLVHLTHCSFY